MVEETLEERYLGQGPSQDIQVSVYPQTCIESACGLKWTFLAYGWCLMATLKKTCFSNRGVRGKWCSISKKVHSIIDSSSTARKLWLSLQFQPFCHKTLGQTAAFLRVHG